MKKYTKKGQAISGGFVLLILLAIFIFYVLPTIQEQQTKVVSYRISLDDDKIVQYSTLTLFYKVVNNQYSTLQGAQIIYEITGTSINGVIEIGDLMLGRESIGNVVLQTRQLQKGSYTIKTVLTYRIGNEMKSADLNLGFEIF